MRLYELSARGHLAPHQHVEGLVRRYSIIKRHLDEAAALKVSPAFLPPATRAPVMTCVGGSESGEFKRQNGLLGARWKGVSAGDIAMPGANHFSVVDGLANQSSNLFAGARRLMKLDR